MKKRRDILNKLTALALAAVMALSIQLTPVEAAITTAPDATWINSDIDGNVTTESAIDAKTDFALYANKEWNLTATIPAGYTSAGAFTDADQEITQQLIGLIKNTELKGHDAQLVRAAYSVATNWDKRNKLGYKPWKKQVKQLASAESLKDIRKYWKSNQASAELLSYSVDTGIDDGTLYLVCTSEAPLLQFDSAEYENPTDYGVAVLSVNKAFSLYVLKRLGYSKEDAQKILDSCIKFEKKLAKNMYTREEQTQVNYLTRINNSYSKAKLKKLAGNYPLMERLRACGYDKSKSYLVTNPGYIKALSKLWTEKNVEQIRDYLLVHDTLSLISVTDKASYDYYIKLYSGFYGTDLTQTPDEEALQYVNAYAPLSLNNLYTQNYVSQETKAEIKQIIEDIVSEYREMLSSEDWLSEETRKEAIKKLDDMTMNVCSPDKLADTSMIKFTQKDNLYKIQKELLALSIKGSAAIINKRKDRTYWNPNELLMNVYDVNAYYNPSDNSINIINGILNGAFYQKDWSYEQKLGAIGMVIGHEISHAFDATGSQFDSEGNMMNWWTTEDAQEYAKRTQKLVDYYSMLTPMGTEEKQNGELVKGEAVADITSMQVILRIAAKQKDFDYDKLFRAYANVWKNKESQQAVYSQFSTDSHPLNYLRINCTLQQFDEFMKCYDIKPGDGMYLAPEDRIVIW